MIDLTKGGRINLTKTSPTLTKLAIGLGWKPNQFSTGDKFDLDASAFLCKTEADGNAKLLSDAHFIFYGNTSDPQGAVTHSGDSTDGTLNIDFGNGVEVDEIVSIDLSKLSPEIDEISFIVTIHEATARKQNFGQVTNSVIVLRDDVTGEVLAKYNLEDDFSMETAAQFGSLVKRDGAWTFKAVGMGHNRGLADFVLAYGGNLA